MKAKKLEFREEIKAPNNYKSIYLFINGKKTDIGGFDYDSNNILKNKGSLLKKKDSDKILSFSFQDLPDNSTIGSFEGYFSETKTPQLDSLTRKGKKLISSYYIMVLCNKTGIIWNGAIYLEELSSILAKKGFTWENDDNHIHDWDDSFGCSFDFTHKNTTGTLLENVNECMEIIKQAEKETHARMLELAIAEGKKN